MLTRNEDVDVSLPDRTALANGLGADLFVSIHLNDSVVPVDTGGITTFLLDGDDRRQPVRLAMRENGTREDEVTGMQRILADLHRTERLEGSRRLAGLVHAETLRHARRQYEGLADRGVRSDVFAVLVGARMPAILLEASFMRLPEDLAALKTAAYRQSLADGIARGIVRYAGGGPPHPPGGAFLAQH